MSHYMKIPETFYRHAEVGDPYLKRDIFSPLKNLGNLDKIQKNTFKELEPKDLIKNQIYLLYHRKTYEKVKAKFIGASVETLLDGDVAFDYEFQDQGNEHLPKKIIISGDDYFDEDDEAIVLGPFAEGLSFRDIDVFELKANDILFEKMLTSKKTKMNLNNDVSKHILSFVRKGGKIKSKKRKTKKRKTKRNR